MTHFLYEGFKIATKQFQAAKTAFTASAGTYLKGVRDEQDTFNAQLTSAVETYGLLAVTKACRDATVGGRIKNKVVSALHLQS